MDKNYVVIMAGGKGERFWPLSTSKHPKQTLALFTGRPLISASVERALALVPRERVFIITNAALVPLMQEIVPELPGDNIIGEPVGRDTAAACMLAAGIVMARDKDAVCTILTADHIIARTDRFCSVINESVKIACREDAILTIGISPSYPSTGFGYVEISGELEPQGGVVFYKAERFVEKPGLSKAAEYVESGRYFWNSGMFIFKASNFMSRLEKLCPDLYEAALKVTKAGSGNALNRLMEQIYPGLRKISVDYAVMEHEKNIIMARASFDWGDVGSWAALSEYFPADPSGNIMIGKVCQIDSRNNIVVSNNGLTALAGVSDMVVVNTGEVTLVCHRSQTERVKEIVKLAALQPDSGDYI